MVFLSLNAPLKWGAFLIGSLCFSGTLQTAATLFPRLTHPHLNRFTFSFSADLSRLWFHERFLPAQPCNLVVFGVITATRCCFLSFSTLSSCRWSLWAKYARLGVKIVIAQNLDCQPSVIGTPGVKNINVASCITQILQKCFSQVFCRDFCRTPAVDFKALTWNKVWQQHHGED